MCIRDSITTAKLASPTRIASPLETDCPGFTETEYEGEPIGFIKTVPFDFITLPMVSADSIFEKIIKINRILFFIIENISVLLDDNLSINIRNLSALVHKLIWTVFLTSFPIFSFACFTNTWIHAVCRI